jgi:hypothetical protein
MDSMFKFSLSGGAWAADCRRLILRSAWERIAKVVRTRIVEAVMIENDNITVGDATKAREVQSMIPDHSNQVNKAEVASSNSNRVDSEEPEPLIANMTQSPATKDDPSQHSDISDSKYTFSHARRIQIIEQVSTILVLYKPSAATEGDDTQWRVYNGTRTMMYLSFVSSSTLFATIQQPEMPFLC